MSGEDETAALVALLRAGGRTWARYVVKVRQAGQARSVSAQALLEQELGLLAYAAQEQAQSEISEWAARGYRLVSVLDPDYPINLSVVKNHPPLLFVAGDLSPADSCSAAVIGTRQPSAAGHELATAVASALSGAGFVVFSGLARGIDTCAHTASLDAGRRTVAVIGTGLEHSYPPENAELQQRISRAGAVISQFWPESPPTRHSFPARNAVMSGLTLASVIIEASPHSGTRIQARHVLEQGRRLILMPPAMREEWAKELSAHAGVTVAQTVEDVLGALER